MKTVHSLLKVFQDKSFVCDLPCDDMTAVVFVDAVELGTISSNMLGASFRKYSLRFGPLISYQPNVVVVCFCSVSNVFGHKKISNGLIHLLSEVNVCVFVRELTIINCQTVISQVLWRISIRLVFFFLNFCIFLE